MQKRRRYYLPASDQPGLLRTLFGIWILVTIAAALILYFGANRDLTAATYKAHFDRMRQTSQVFVPYLLAGNLLAAIAVLLLGILYTHRVAGPIYQIERRLGRLRDGDLKVSFAVRKHDQFHSLADALNDAMGSIRARLDRVREASDRLEAMRTTTGTTTADWDGALRDLRQSLEELQS